MTVAFLLFLLPPATTRRRTRRPLLLFVHQALLLSTVSRISSGFSSNAPIRPWPSRSVSSPPPPQRPSSTLFLSTIVDDSELDALTPPQVQALRRETAQRRAAKTLATVFLPRGECEGPPFSRATLAEIAAPLRSSALVGVRGVAVDSRRRVRTVAERLALEVELENSDGKPVFVVDIRGHACVLFRPNGDVLPLRTTLKTNQWQKRPRKPRDSAGQIIR